MKNHRVIFVILMLFTGFGTAAQKTKTTSKTAVADTVILDSGKDSILIPFEPHETKYQQALNSA